MVEPAMHSLVAMREEILAHMHDHAALRTVDADFVHLFSSWFNRGFLVLRRIDWATSASIIEKIIRYEAVHAIGSWDDLRHRLDPDDRRCFAFFHPRLADEPLIFVEVALMRQMPARIGQVLADDREQVRAEEATTAVFYSISNCQVGLRGISFGNFLLKQVIEELRRELPGIRAFATLSPVPGFAAWLAEAGDDLTGLSGAEHAELLGILSGEDWPSKPATVDALRSVLPPITARYLAQSRDEKGLPVDPVARFHLGNGARLERINFLGDPSPQGRATGHGMMVNYLYNVDEVEKNHELFASRGVLVMSRSVRRLLGDAATAKRHVVPSDMQRGRSRQVFRKDSAA
jgi:malonyl-CoA decarboxylase